jgi:glycosidase
MAILTPKIYVRKELINLLLNENLTISEDGSIFIPDSFTTRILSEKIKIVFAKNVFPGKLYSFALLNSIFDFVINKYDTQENPEAISLALDETSKNFELKDFEYLVGYFNSIFPIKKILLGDVSIPQFLESIKIDKELKKTHTKNQILIYLSNLNYAVNDLSFLFDHSDVVEKTIYNKVNKTLEEYFRQQKPVDKVNKPLIDLLKEPIVNNPHSLEAQLQFIKENWSQILPEEFVILILKSLDLIKEDSKIFQAGFGGKGETKVPTFSIEELLGLGDKFSGALLPLTPVEEEKFTPDIDWMPKVVLLAKNTYVWLDQLSKKYNREIKRLDQIPDEELDLIASYNFNALWLIGIWERSSASRKIKNLAGNPEALASAYSIYDYVIAKDLGGEEAYQVLNQKCWNRGIRLACDIVPNHMGIYSKWVIEHPDYFIQTDRSPFPSYSFTGPNLSEHPDYQIRIEDKYWTRQDAAVVFQLIENKTGRVRYIYHGNDGTSMPWNDTAQLNLLLPEVREALYNLILNVAKKFSIIRLDAAMTLTQKHYQRLWFPVPGTGGTIPSRSDFAMSTDEFLKHYPKEFWREVVDRINIDKPDTLLLAEAFWLMEGYFVRTLGMHRVYNSAFMNMLKNEENSKYRKLVVNTLEFNPEILKRYVNFLSNPDEETAINQFGDGDKYFGCAVMMVTMPGLPMFAHGQIEGLREKYGHEYYKAYYDEKPNEFLIERHKREIFPLMRKRYLFSQVEKFEFYDFKGFDGNAIEDVFVYSNLSGSERALVFYNNCLNTYEGYIDFSCPKNYGSSDDENLKKLVSKNLGEALELKNSNKHFYIFREAKTNLEYLRRGSDFFDSKFSIKIKGYEYFVFLDFVEVYDTTGELEELYYTLNFNGVTSVQNELINLRATKLAKKLSPLFNKEKFNEVLRDFEDKDKLQLFLDYAKNLIKTNSQHLKIDQTKFLMNLMLELEPLSELMMTFEKLQKRKSNPKWLNDSLSNEFSQERLNEFLYSYFVATLLNLLENSSSLEKNFISVIRQNLTKLLFDKIHQQDIVFLLQILTSNQRQFNFEHDVNDNLRQETLKQLKALVSNEALQKFLDANEYQNVIYYSKEKFEKLTSELELILILNRMRVFLKNSASKKRKLNLMHFIKELREINQIKKELLNLSDLSRYRLREMERKLNELTN